MLSIFCALLTNVRPSSLNTFQYGLNRYLKALHHCKKSNIIRDPAFSDANEMLENMEKMTKAIFAVKVDSTGLKYVHKAVDELTKNHRACDKDNVSGFMPEEPDSLMCRVPLFQTYIDKLHSDLDRLWQNLNIRSWMKKVSGLPENQGERTPYHASCPNLVDILICPKYIPITASVPQGPRYFHSSTSARRKLWRSHVKI
ncbi:uncharacterized protein LOC135475751 [Liolophura sinensis]|uniref:uncharacterized protein LOC135475751 n=1 Tax=Liolophura sinensis TaxID=3198878 RepID=UPI003158E566